VDVVAWPWGGKEEGGGRQLQTWRYPHTTTRRLPVETTIISLGRGWFWTGGTLRTARAFTPVAPVSLEDAAYRSDDSPSHTITNAPDRLPSPAPAYSPRSAILLTMLTRATLPAWRASPARSTALAGELFCASILSRIPQPENGIIAHHSSVTEGEMRGDGVAGRICQSHAVPATSGVHTLGGASAAHGATVGITLHQLWQTSYLYQHYRGALHALPSGCLTS